MFHKQSNPPELLPVLSRGKHRNPRKGACFMEMASWLAGEGWSDHPRCTHRLLASLARLVNDYTSDGHRNRLIELVPSVIGITSDNVRLDATIALRAGTTALPLVSADRQNVMAVSVLAADHVLADLDGRPRDQLLPETRRALEKAPEAKRWAERFARHSRLSVKNFRRFSAPTSVACAVPGIAEALVPDTDDVLYRLLVGAIEDARALAEPAVAESAATTPTPIRALGSAARR